MTDNIQKVYWRMSPDIYARYAELVLERDDALAENDAAHAHELEDRIRSLPGYPSKYDHNNADQAVVPYIVPPVRSFGSADVH